MPPLCFQTMDLLPKILICDDDAAFQVAVKHSFKGRVECLTAKNCDEALIILKNHAIDILLLDVSIRTPDEGLQFIPKFLELDPDLAIVMSSSRTDYKTVREAMKLGAWDYTPKDFVPEELEHTLLQTLQRRSLLERQEQQNFEARSYQKQHVLVGDSPAILSLKKIVERAKSSTANVVIHGETGTGKEVVARQLRKTLPDGALAPFVAVDSSTIQSSMAESILFGHEKGAFTGAERITKGIFEEANGGIVYFDEIANMPLEIQAKLLRVLQEKEVTRVGSSKVMRLEFRAICATNKNLEEMAKNGTFKDDLLQRLNVIPIELPPLRDRTEDIPLLIRYFCEKHHSQGRLNFTSEAMTQLIRYAWPGNIRELENLITYLSAMLESSDVHVDDLPSKLRKSILEKTAMVPIGTGTFYDRTRHFEKRLLEDEYVASDGNISKLAEKLGMDRSHLYSKLKEYGIQKKTK